MDIYIIVLAVILVYLLFNNKTLEHYYVDGQDSWKQMYYHYKEPSKDKNKHKKHEMLLINYKSLPESDIQIMKSRWSECFTNGETYVFDNNTTMIMYYVDGKVAGYCGMLTTDQLERFLANNGIHQQSIWSMLNDQHGLYLYNLCVFPEYRRRGIGARILKNVINFANEHRKTYINLIVLKNQHIPIKMYRKLKFTEFYESVNSLNNMKVIIMKKFLRDNPNFD